LPSGSAFFLDNLFFPVNFKKGKIFFLLKDLEKKVFGIDWPLGKDSIPGQGVRFIWDKKIGHLLPRRWPIFHVKMFSA